MRKATIGIIVKEDRILLGLKKRGEIGKDTFNGPGGKLEPGETLAQCLIRETLEELGITLKEENLEHIAVITFYAGEEAEFEVTVYRVETFEGTPIETDDMIPQWFPKDDLPYSKMLEADKMWFARAVHGEKFTADVYYNEKAFGFSAI